MQIKVNLYYDVEKRILSTDYAIKTQYDHGTTVLVGRFLDVDRAREFIERCHLHWPTFADIKYFPVLPKEVEDYYFLLYGNKSRISRIKVKDPLPVIITERAVGHTILAGSRFFCGACGNQIATMAKRSRFPFMDGYFFNNIIDSKFKLIEGDALQCGTCEYILGLPTTGYVFCELMEYFEMLPKMLKEYYSEGGL